MNPAQITKTLTERADRFAGPGLDVEQVLARAGEIRRGRRMRASIVMAAVVLAVAVPIGITTLTADGSATKPHVTTPATKPDTSPLGLDDKLDIGNAPKTGYAYGGGLNAGSLGIVTASTTNPVSLARIDGGFLVAEPKGTGGDLMASFVADDGNGPEVSWPTTGSFAVTPDGGIGAFVEPDGTVVAVEAGGSRYYEVGKIPSGEGFDVVAVDGDNCSGRSEEVGCTVYVVEKDAHPRTWAVSPHRAPETAFDRYRMLSAVAANGSAVGLTTLTDTGSCSEADEIEGVKLFSTCDYRFSSFSPDSKHLIGFDTNSDGMGPTDLAVLDTSGTVVFDLKTVTDATITGMVWEDDDHVLAAVYDHDRAAVIRIGLDGSREYALKPVAASYDAPEPYLLP